MLKNWYLKKTFILLIKFYVNKIITKEINIINSDDNYKFSKLNYK